MTEAKRNSLKRKIKHYRAILNEEKRKYGDYDDSPGLRYAIAELYLTLEDFAGASRYYNLFDKRFSDDISYAYFKFGWARAKFETKNYEIARLKIVEMTIDNTYILSLLTNFETVSIDKHEWNQHETYDYAVETLSTYQKLLNPKFISWLTSLRSSAEYSAFYNELIGIQRLLKGMSVSEERSRLLSAKSDLTKRWENGDFNI